MDSLEQTLLMIICLDIVLVLGQAAITGINPSSTLSFIHLNSTMVGNPAANWRSGNDTNPVLSQNDSLNLLPSGVNPVSPDSGVYFSDIFSIVKSWAVLVPTLIFSLFFAPVVYLGALGLPALVIYVIGTGWFLFNLVLIVKLLTGR